MIDINAIKEALPHRYPMLLVDRVLEVKEDEIVALKNVTINEPFFNGHFPKYPVMPVVPGDQLIMTAKFVKRRGTIAVVEAKAEVDGKLAASGTLTFALGQ